jgi:hypothetical protein
LVEIIILPFYFFALVFLLIKQYIMLTLKSFMLEYLEKDFDAGGI